jgi:hypothetical protein
VKSVKSVVSGAFPVAHRLCRRSRILAFLQSRHAPLFSPSLYKERVYAASRLAAAHKCLKKMEQGVDFYMIAYYYHLALKQKALFV